MTDTEMKELIGLWAKASNEQRQRLMDNIAYTDRELKALLAKVEAAAAAAAAAQKTADENDLRLDSLDEAEVVRLAKLFVSELAEAGVDQNKLNEWLQGVKDNAADIAAMDEAVEQLKSRADAADRDRASIKETQGDHGKRITALEQREDQVGISEERAKELDRDAVGLLAKTMIDALIPLVPNGTAPITGEAFDGVTGSLVASSEPAEEAFSDA